MIKILFIHRRMDCGGVEQALFDLVNLMDKSLFDITILLQQDGGEWEQKFLDAGIKMTHVYDCQESSWNPVVKGINLIKRKRLERAWKQNGKGALDVALPGKYDLIINFGAVTFDEMCFYGKAKTVKYIHGDATTNFPYQQYIQKNGNLFRQYDRIVCVSEVARRSFANAAGFEDNVLAYFNPVNSQNIRQRAQEKVELSLDVPLVCAVGRLAPEKGFDRLVRIHKNLLDKGIYHRLIIVGEGQEREKIQDIIYKTNTEQTVILCGKQENPYPYMAQSNFMVCSSYTEGLSLVALEAICLGVPVVSAVPTIYEIFGDEECGIVTQNDDASLEAGIERMLTDTEFYNIAKQAAQRRSQFFDGQRMVKEIEEMYLDLLK